LNSLSLAAIILLLARPTGLFEAGWQLSFASVLGILAFCRRIHFFIYEKIAGYLWIKDSLTTRPFFKIVAKPGPAILALFTTGLSAWIGSAGILLYHFHTINPLTSIWTVAAFPFVVMILAFGFLKILLSFVLPTIAGWFGAIVSFFAGCLIWIVKFIAGLNISEILIGHTPVWLIVLYYALVLFAGFSWFKTPTFKRIAFIFTTIAILTYLGAIKWQRTYRENLDVVVLDVGHGQAILARLPEGTNLLFDSGSSTRSDVGTRVVGPFLRYNGIRSIDALVISHADIDHINGIPEVADYCRVKSFYASGALFQDSRPTAVFLKKLIPVNDINTLPKSALIKTLWPTSDVLENNLISENDKALVTLLEYAGRQILICSDIEKFAQREILNLYPDLKADVLIAPHHGSAKTLQREFLEAIQPKVVICSCAESACEKKQVIKKGETFSSYYTGTDGAVTIRINNSGIIETDKFRKEQNPLIPR
jgi:competence protein ComEC